MRWRGEDDGAAGAVRVRWGCMGRAADADTTSADVTATETTMEANHAPRHRLLTGTTATSLLSPLSDLCHSHPYERHQSLISDPEFCLRSSKTNSPRCAMRLCRGQTATRLSPPPMHRRTARPSTATRCRTATHSSYLPSSRRQRYASEIASLERPANCRITDICHLRDPICERRMSDVTMHRFRSYITRLTSRETRPHTAILIQDRLLDPAPPADPGSMPRQPTLVPCPTSRRSPFRHRRWSAAFVASDDRSDDHSVSHGLVTGDVHYTATSIRWRMRPGHIDAIYFISFVYFFALQHNSLFDTSLSDHGSRRAAVASRLQVGQVAGLGFANQSTWLTFSRFQSTWVW